MTTFTWPNFSQLPKSLKAMYVAVLCMLGLGYIFGIIQIYETDAGKDGNPMLGVEDIRIAYSGSQTDTRLEVALKGPMSSMISSDKKEKLINWIHSGRKKATFDTDVLPIIKEKCILCHSGSNPHIPTITNYNEVKTLTNLDTGISIATLVRVSHIHLFGLTFIFFIIGLIFSHVCFKSEILKTAIMLTPFIAIFLDVASWWMTKVDIVFAYVVMGGGALMALSFATMWVCSMYQIFFYTKTRKEKCIPE